MTPEKVRVQLLGGFRLRIGSAGPRALDSVRMESLLAYLALHPGPQPRQHLAGLLWPETPEPQARTNLRHLLHTLRAAGVADLLDVTPRTLAWHAAEVDVATFEAELDRAAAGACADRITALRDAVGHYPGDLLPSHDDEWVRTERERLRARFCDALEELGTALRAENPADAVGLLERLVAADPLRESAYRQLILAHQARGDRSRAVQTYHRCAAVLERELDVAPSAETRAAYAAALPSHAQTGTPRGDEPPLVGRAAERQALTEAWRMATSEGARLVLLTGEPGIGKTRLAEEFAAWATRHGAATATARAHAAEGALAYDPVAAWLRSPALRPGLDRLGDAHRAELARLLPGLAATTPEHLPEEEQRRRMFDAVWQAIRAVGRPLLLVADDLHWFDPESLRLVHYLVRTGSDLPLLVAATARPEATAEDHPVRAVLTGLRSLGQVLERELAPLSADEVTALASRLGGDVPDAAALYADSEGNPLFLVEALRAGWPARRQVTPRVRAVIESRLAQLSPPTRDLLGVAATVGREFTADVLAAASGSSADAVLAALDELWLRRIIRDQGGDAYDFAHDKIREVAYATAPPARRRRHHRGVADALSRAGADTPDELSGRIADHYLRAGAPEDAAGWTLRAADAAARLHADAAAIAIVTRNVLALRALPPTSERERHELVLLTAVVGLIGTDEGFTAERVLRVQTRALALAERLSEPPEPTLIRSLALTSLSRADFPHAREYGEQLRARGERTDDDVLLVEGSYVLGIVAFWEGRLSAAREHFEHAVLRFRPEHRTTHILRYGLDTRVVCQSRLANTLWLLGEQEAAVAARDRALVMAEEGGHPFSLATALTFAAFLAVDMAATDELRHFTRRLRSLRLDATAHMLAVEALHGLVTAVDGQAAEGLRLIDDALERARSRPPTPGTPVIFLRLRLAAALATGNHVEAAATARALLDCGYGTWRSVADSVLTAPTNEERSRNASSATLG